MTDHAYFWPLYVVCRPQQSFTPVLQALRLLQNPLRRQALIFYAGCQPKKYQCLSGSWLPVSLAMRKTINWLSGWDQRTVVLHFLSLLEVLAPVNRPRLASEREEWKVLPSPSVTSWETACREKWRNGRKSPRCVIGLRGKRPGGMQSASYGKIDRKDALARGNWN